LLIESANLSKDEHILSYQPCLKEIPMNIDSRYLYRAFLFLLASVFMLLLGGCATPSFNNKINTESAEFGLFDDYRAKHLVFTKTSHVPWKLGQSYGWRMLSTLEKGVMIREELILPSPAVYFGSESSTGYLAVMEDRKTVIYEDLDKPENGYIYRFWEIAPEDPKGTHVLKIFIDGKLAKQFVFEID